MGFVESFALALALSVDALICAVLYSKCSFDTSIKLKIALVLSGSFGFFQFFMPVVGFFAGAAVVALVGSYDHYVAFVLLLYVSGKMLYDGFKREEDKAICCHIPYFTIFLLSIATSIDALALGVSVGILYDTIFSFALIVGITCFTVSFMGSMAGQALGKIKRFDKTLNILGALVLLGIGVKVLIDHDVIALA